MGLPPSSYENEIFSRPTEGPHLAWKIGSGFKVRVTVDCRKRPHGFRQDFRFEAQNGQGAHSKRWLRQGAFQGRRPHKGGDCQSGEDFTLRKPFLSFDRMTNLSPPRF